VSFLARYRYLSLEVPVRWKPGCQPKLNKFHIYEISQEMLYLTTQRIRKFAFLGEKIP
jgi:hypothetical protein